MLPHATTKNHVRVIIARIAQCNQPMDTRSVYYDLICLMMKRASVDFYAAVQSLIILLSCNLNSFCLHVSLATKMFRRELATDPSLQTPHYTELLLSLGDVCVVNNSPGNDADAVSVAGSRGLCFSCVVE